MIELTVHATERCAQRNLRTDEKIAYVLQHGTRIRRTGVTFVFLRRRDIPFEDRRVDRLARLEGTILLVGNDVIITAYHRRDALKAIRRKVKFATRKPALVQRERLAA
ncbi:MAG: DUF4258 domain-containing protein [Dehalococcoidia bacterium]